MVSNLMVRLHITAVILVVQQELYLYQKRSNLSRIKVVDSESIHHIIILKVGDIT